MTGYRLVDVSMPLGAFDFPGDQAFERHGPFDHVSGENPEYVYDLNLSTQSGTHVQGAHYFAADGRHIDKYPLDRFEGWATCIELDKRGADTTVPDLEEALDGVELTDGMLVLETGHMDEVVERGTLEPGSRPGLSLDAARWLVEEHDLRFLAIDSVGVESRITNNYEVTVFLGEHDVLLLEGLVNLCAVSSSDVWLEAFPLRIGGVEGTPCRAIIKEPIDET